MRARTNAAPLRAPFHAPTQQRLAHDPAPRRPGFHALVPLVEPAGSDPANADAARRAQDPTRSRNVLCFAALRRTRDTLTTMVVAVAHAHPSAADAGSITRPALSIDSPTPASTAIMALAANPPRSSPRGAGRGRGAESTTSKLASCPAAIRADSALCVRLRDESSNAHHSPMYTRHSRRTGSVSRNHGSLRIVSMAVPLGGAPDLLLGIPDRGFRAPRGVQANPAMPHNAGMTQPAVPVPPRTRIVALDAARGLALLGILIVNIDFAAMPLGMALDIVPVNEHTLRDKILFYASAVFCEGKFYGLFSLLFGIGFAMQRQRLLGTGRYVPVYLRRVFFLGALGLLHALGIWFGDILFLYAAGALLLMVLGSLRPRALVAIGVSIFVFVALVASLFALVTPMDQTPARGVPAESLTAPAIAEPTPDAGPALPSDPTASTAPAPSPFLQLVGLWKDGKAYSFTDPGWVRLDIQAHQRGPYLDLFLFRAVSWVMMLLFTMIGFGWTIIAMFCFGAAMLKSGAFDPARLGLHRRLALLGLFVGLPLVAVGYTLVGLNMTPGTLALHSLTHTLGAPLLSLGYLSAMVLLVHAGRAERATTLLANTGRLALTNYLMQSLFASSIFYFYGLGLYGQTDRTERYAIVAAIYAFQLAFSTLYLRRFRYGPMEWLWRRFTYLRPLPGPAPT
ncbi:MAG: DUF418 domain-containing protein [Phycisphaerae bacterium]|nr:DUF418 domain-containing protein [Phycisphaerae bacterium]